MIHSIANIITIARIIGAIFLILFMPFQTEAHQLWSILFFILLAFSDFLDGWLARKFNIESLTGKILDPFADKILVLVLLPLISMGAIHFLPVAIIIFREFSVMSLRLMIIKTNTTVQAGLTGKIKTALTLPLCCILMARITNVEPSNLSPILIPLQQLKNWVQLWPQQTIHILIWMTVLITILSFLDYFFSYLFSFTFIKFLRKKTKLKIGLKLIPSIVSLGNAIAGGLAIWCCLQLKFDQAAMLILIGMICDGFDGYLARLLNAELPIGKYIDFSADVITFGIAPAFYIYMQLISASVINHTTIPIALGISYLICVVYRLFRFTQGQTKNFFEGIPCTIAASILVVFGSSKLLNTPYVFITLCIILGALMVSRVLYPHNRIIYRSKTLQLARILFGLGMLIFIFCISLNLTAFHSIYLVEILFGLSLFYMCAPFFISAKK